MIILNIEAGGLVHIDLIRLFEWRYRFRYTLIVDHSTRDLFSFCHRQLVDVLNLSAGFVVILHFFFL